MSCYEEGRLVNDTLEKIATQYRESNNFKDFIKVYLKDLEAIQLALCETEIVGLDRLGEIVNFPRCFCNIKKKRWFGFTQLQKFWFGFDYVDGETVKEDPAYLTGLDSGSWKSKNDSMNTPTICCSPDESTVLGFCEGEFNCGKLPEYEDYCFEDDEHYAKLLRLKILSDNSDNSLSDIKLGLQILFGDQVYFLQERSGEVTFNVGRKFTTEEKLLLDFYKLLLPAPIGVKVSLYESFDVPVFGFGGSDCCGDWLGGFCSGLFHRRY